ncbi:hypothetical protein OJAG_32340 [Oerskovia enterophila]|uniref:Leucine Rich repeats (2 copies) n=1 Tax=Oerskovia enterophila TaxID=43678 RepID=A0A163QEH8_9CELL|nr:hypothetical protein OJAG_32340 [Oerskovia enterophila]
MPSLRTVVAYDGQRPYRIGEVHDEPTTEDLAWMRARDVDGLSIRPPRGTRRVFPLNWVEGLGPLRYLEIVSPRPVGAVPASIVGGLEILHVQGRLHAELDLARAQRLRSLTLAQDQVEALSSAPVLEHCGLESATRFSSSIFEGCATLRSAFVTADNRAANPVWDFSAQGEIPLERLTLMDGGARSLDGIAALPRLRELTILPREDVGLEQHLDLRPLAACSRLRRLVLHRSGTLDNAHVLDELTDLETVKVRRGAVDRTVEDRAWLRVL